MLACCVNSRAHLHGASRSPSSLPTPSRLTSITLKQTLRSQNPFRSNTSASVASKELKTLWNQHLQKTGGGVVIMVNHVLETSHPPSSAALCLRVSVVAPSSILSTYNSHSGTHLSLPLRLCFHSLPCCPFCNSFLFKFMQEWGRVHTP